MEIFDTLPTIHQITNYHIYSNFDPVVLLFLSKNKDKTLQIVLHCEIIQGVLL